MYSVVRTANYHTPWIKGGLNMTPLKECAGTIEVVYVCLYYLCGLDTGANGMLCGQASF